MTSSAICNPCKKLEDCDKYCPVRAGENIVNFVNDILVDTVETKIGDCEKDKVDGNTYLINVGYMITKGEAPVNVLKKLPEKGIIIKPKFNSNWEMSPTQILKAYTTYEGKDKKVQLKATEDLKKFISPKILPKSVNLGWDIEVTKVGFDGKSRKIITSIEAIKWTLDTEDGDIKGYIFAKVGKTEDGKNVMHFELSDYGKTWTLPNIERNLKTSEVMREAIQMYGTGLIAPIEMTYQDTTFAIDGQYVYQVKPNETHVIGKWVGSEIKLKDSSLINSKHNKALNKIMTIYKFIDKHRRFMVPYGLGKANVINL